MLLRTFLLEEEMLMTTIWRKIYNSWVCLILLV